MASGICRGDQSGAVAVPEGRTGSGYGDLLKAMTVDYLFSDTFPLSGEQVISAAPESRVDYLPVGKHLGSIGTASTTAKCELAKSWRDRMLVER